MRAIMVLMQARSRFYSAILKDHLENHRQMALVSGPRQVGKTTTCRLLSDQYLNWDNTDDRRNLLHGPAALAETLRLDRLRPKPAVALLDELHKYSKWKSLLKGFFDTYGDRVHLIVTGSSRLRRGSDSLMGRYLVYRMTLGAWAKACIRTCPPERFDPRLKSRRQNGTRCGSTEDSLSLFSAATAALRADGGPSVRNNCRGKTCMKSPRWPTSGLWRP